MPTERKIGPDEDLLLRAYGAFRIEALTIHSDRCVTLVCSDDAGHVWKARWNQADDGHWTLIPVSEAYYPPSPQAG